jgi:hypothetical protein
VTDSATAANTPTGRVQFKFTEGESSSPAETLTATLSKGMATVTTSSLAAGSYTVTATLQPGTSQFQTSDGTTPLIIESPVPDILSLSPMTVTAEGPAFMLTVNGSSFIHGSVVIWNSSPRITTYVSTTQLTAQILASDLINAGSAMVTVYNDIPGGGTSPAATITITRASQTISFPALPNVSYGVAPFTLTATTSSGLPVTFTISSGPAKIEDGVLTVTGAGWVVVVASQAGDANYNPAPSVPPQGFSVAQAHLTATCNSFSKVYATPNPALGGTIAGLQNGDTLRLTCSTSSITASAAGSYAITPVLSGSALPNYLTALHPGTLTVTKAPLTLTANSLTSYYGSAVPMLTYTLSGLVNGDTPTTAFTGAPSLTTSATPASKVGNYPITAAMGTLVSQSYQVKFAPGILSVTKAELLVIANSVSSAYGSKIPSLTSTITGFVNHDSASAISGEPALSTTATSKSTVGNYPIACAAGTLAAANYSFQCVPGTLTIAKATLTVTVTNGASVYGAPYPAFTYVLSGFLNGDTAKTASSGAPHLATTPAAKYGTGAYPINATIGTLTSVDYDFDFVPGILNIAPAPLTFSANDILGFYGSNPPTFTYQVMGYVNGDTAATAFTGVPSLTTTVTKESPVGHYPITVSGGSLASNKYSFQFVPGTLTIAKAQLTVTANNVSSVYGSAISAFTYTLSGFHNGDTQKTAVTGAPSLSSTGNASSPADTYPIVAETGTLASSNYKFKFVAGALTIAKALLTVTASNASVAFDKPLPKLTYTTKGFVNGDTSTVLSGAPLETTTAKQGSAAGKYPITITQGTLAAANYRFTFNNGTLTITATGSVATTAFPPAAGTYASAQSATIKDETPGATIYYAPLVSNSSTQLSKPLASNFAVAQPTRRYRPIPSSNSAFGDFEAH